MHIYTHVICVVAFRSTLWLAVNHQDSNHPFASEVVIQDIEDI